MSKSEIAKAVATVAELTGATLSEAALRRMVDRLAGYPGEAVAVALARCELELRGPLTLGAIVDRIDDGYPGPEEAWAIVAQIGEDKTVVWIDQIAAAWAVASGVLPDRVGARMAFLERYRRAVAEARSAGTPPRWWASVGLDPSGRPGPIQEAVARGRLSIPEARAALPPEAWPAECQPALTTDPVLPKALTPGAD